MFSIYTTDGKLAYKGPDNKPYMNEDQAQADVKDRNTRAAEMGLMVRYGLHFEVSKAA